MDETFRLLAPSVLSETSTFVTQRHTVPRSAGTPLSGKDSTLIVSAEDLIFDEGDKAEAVYCVLSGGVLLSRTGEQKKTQILDVVGQGQIFGFTPDRQHAYRAVALAPSVVSRIDYEQARSSTSTQLMVSEHLARSLARLQNRAFLFGRHGVGLQRLSQAILSLPKSHDHEKDEAGAKLFWDSRIMLSQTELSSFLNVSPITISSSIAQLKSRRIISVPSRRVVLIHDTGALQSISRGDNDLS